MRVLVTGAGGFIGSHVVELLVRDGHQVRALVRYNSRNSWGHLGDTCPEILSEVDVRLGDVRDAGRMRELVRGCDAVLHLAALIGIPYSYAAPASYVQTNIEGTLNILEASREVGVARIIVTSTSEVYGSAHTTPMLESHPLQAQSPYAATKIGADKLAESYARSFGLPVVILRPFNTYGPRQSARAIIPTILTQALAGAREIRLGNLSPRRDLTFVEDTARAFLLAMRAPGIEGHTIHFGQGTAISIGDLAALCLDVVGSDAQVVAEPRRVRADGSEVETLLCNAGLARQELGWEPTIPLREGLERTAAYIKQHLDEYRIDEYTV
jgi:NAD dependent epimerase/dehydratase